MADDIVARGRGVAQVLRNGTYEFCDCDSLEADNIDAMADEIERLRAALQEVTDNDWRWAGSPATGDSRKQSGPHGETARRALAGTHGEG